MISDIKSLLIINEGFSDNIGDQAIKESMEFLVKNELNCKYFFEDLTRRKKINSKFNNSNYSKKTYNNKQPNLFKTWVYRFLWLTKNFYRLKNASRKNDYAVIGGGQLLLANNIFPFEIFIWTLFLNFYKVRYSFFSVGTQGNFSKSDFLSGKNLLNISLICFFSALPNSKIKSTRLGRIKALSKCSL